MDFWGVHARCGGDSREVRELLKGVQKIQSTRKAFAALLADGTVVSWGDQFLGGDSSKVQTMLQQVQDIQSSSCSFAAILANGSVVTWGRRNGGGDSSRVNACSKKFNKFSQPPWPLQLFVVMVWPWLGAIRGLAGSASPWKVCVKLQHPTALLLLYWSKDLLWLGVNLREVATAAQWLKNWKACHKSRLRKGHSLRFSASVGSMWWLGVCQKMVATVDRSGTNCKTYSRFRPWSAVKLNVALLVTLPNWHCWHYRRRNSKGESNVGFPTNCKWL